MRYDYAGPYKSFEKANDSLEDCFADGSVSSGEAPRVERREHKTASWAKGRTRFYVTLEDWS